MTHRNYSISKLSLVLIVFIAPLVACNSSISDLISGGSVISGAVLAKDIKADDGSPVNIVTEYAPEQKVFHLIVTASNAPKDTAVKAVWTAVDIGGTNLPNTKLDESVLVVVGSGNFEFTLASKTGKWSPGKYKVDLLVNNKTNRTLNFTVVGTIAARLPTPTVTPVVCPKPTTPAIKPLGYISKVTMAENTQGVFKDPVNPTTVFKPTAVFHAVIAVKNAPANVQFRAIWFASDIGSAAPCNRLLDDKQVTYPGGTANLDTWLESKNVPWPIGSYRVEISINDKLDQVVNFSVKE